MNWNGCLKKADPKDILWNYPPPRIPVTTRIIPFLVGNPYKPSFVTITGWGGRPKIYLNSICVVLLYPSHGESSPFGRVFLEHFFPNHLTHLSKKICVYIY